jgi:4-hydroxy-tetrahydrodipicolinate synthase
MFGISAALTTPFLPDGAVDVARLNDHIKTVLAESCTSVTMFGTTGEGASVAGNTRLETLRAAVDAQIDPASLVLTLHGAAASDVAQQVTGALEIGVTRFLIPPPCYFNAPENTGLYRWFAEVLSPFKDTGAQFILYHIPQVIGVGLAIDLVARLKAAYPDLVLGVKDSSGSFENTRQLLQLEGLEILVGDERQLAACARIGASGSISGVANVFSDRLARVLADGVDDPALNDLVETVLMFSVTPAVKSLVACKYGANEWRRTSAPLLATSDENFATLATAYDNVAAAV